MDERRKDDRLVSVNTEVIARGLALVAASVHWRDSKAGLASSLRVAEALLPFIRGEIDAESLIAHWGLKTPEEAKAEEEASRELDTAALASLDAA